MSNSNAQKSNVNIIGSNNETKVNQFNISIYANDVLSITNELRENIINTLEGELVNSELNVFLCYPNILKDKLFDSCIKNLKTELSKIDAVIYEGGGKQTLPDTESVYIHIAELDFINKKCDSIIIFVLDELTLSQITLISYYKITKDIKNPDLIVICNDKIKNLPEDFNGRFVVEESYYETNGKRHASPHLFLITETEQGILLSSYEIPEGEDKKVFSYASMKKVDYAELKKSEKFTPALYHEKDGIWEGGSISQFSPVMIFKLWEKFSDRCLEVSESMEVNGKRTFGYDEPIIYKRI